MVNAAVFMSIGLWRAITLDGVTAIIGTVLVVVAANGLYFPGVSLLADLWFLSGFLVTPCFSGGALLKLPQIPD
jgi:hypothetical protein